MIYDVDMVFWGRGGGPLYATEYRGVSADTPQKAAMAVEAVRAHLCNPPGVVAVTVRRRSDRDVRFYRYEDGTLRSLPRVTNGDVKGRGRIS